MTMFVCEAKATCDTIEDLEYNFCPPDKEYNPDNARTECVKSNCDKDSAKDVNSCCQNKRKSTDGKCEGQHYTQGSDYNNCCKGTPSCDTVTDFPYKIRFWVGVTHESLLIQCFPRAFPTTTFLPVIVANGQLDRVRSVLFACMS